MPHLGGPAPGWRWWDQLGGGSARAGGVCTGTRRKRLENPTNAKQRLGRGEMPKKAENWRVGKSSRAEGAHGGTTIAPQHPMASHRGIPRDPTRAALLAQPHWDVAWLHGRGIAGCSSALTAGARKASTG